MASPSATPTDARPTLKEALGAAAALGAGVAWLFGRALFFDSALHGRDVMHHYWPLQEAVTRAWAAGHFPHWDPSAQGGVPLLANINAGVLYPPNVLYRLLEFPRAYAWLLVFHLLVLGLGAWLLFRRYVGHGPALLGALALVLSGPVLSLNVFGPFLGALAWVPWVAWALVALGSTPLAIGVGALGLGLQLLAGDPMPALFSGIFALALLALAERRPRRLLAAAAAGGLALLLAAAQVLPALYLLRESNRAGGVAELWSLHPLRLFELGLPTLFGHYLDEPPFWGMFLSSGPGRIPFLLSVYLGATALTLAMVGVSKARFATAGLAVFWVGLALSLGSAGFAGPLLQTPPLSFFRYPEKYVLLMALGCSALVAQGAAHLAAGRRRPWAGVPLLVGAAGVIAAGPARPWLEALLRTIPTWPGTRFIPAAAAETIGAASQTAALLAALLVALVLLAPRLTPARRLGVAGVAIGLDLVLAGHPVVWTGPLDLYRSRPPVVAALEGRARVRPFRIWRDNAALEVNVQMEGTYAALAARRAFELATLKPAVGTIWGIDEASVASAVVLERWAQLTKQVGPNLRRWLALLNACFVVAPAARGPALGLEGTTALVIEEGVALFEPETCLPRLFSPSTALPAANLGEALQRVAAPEFDPRWEAVAEAALPTPGGPLEILESAYGPDGSVAAQVRAPEGGGLLVYSALYGAGWSAVVDGQSQAAFPVDGALVGTWVEKGTHGVILRYRTPAFSASAVLSVAGLLASVVLCALGATAKKRHPIQ